MARKKSAAKKAKEAAAKAENPNVVNPEEKQIKSSEKSVEEPAKPEKKKTEKPQESGDEDDDEESSSSDEDEYGELLTENVEHLIQKVMEALKKDPKQLLNPDKKFFDATDMETIRKVREKPLFLKDYHRQNLLSGDYKKDEDDEYGTVDGEKPFVVTEREERNQLLDDIKNAFKDEEGDDDDDDDGLLKKKEKKEEEEVDTRTKLPDPEKNAEGFLSAFLDNRAWIPGENDKVINLDQIDNDDEQNFDDAVDDFERAYNFRYEDPNSSEIVSYARNQATLRRGKTSARQREREKKNAQKEKERQELEKKIQQKKTGKLNKVVDRLKLIKEAVGDEVSDEVIQKVFGDSLLNDDFDDADWDNKMAQIFDEQYYGSEVTKPTWNEDDEIMGEFHESKKKEEAEDNDDDDEEDDDDDDEADEQETEKTEAQPKSKKEKLSAKKEAKKEKQSLREKAEKLVEANKLRIKEEVEEERGRGKESDATKFKYREVSPESFGLSTREIFLADDADLNKLISIKKFAPYRPKELVLKDKRKYAKKKHLQQWRKDVFKDKEGPKRNPEEGENEIWLPAEEERPKKKSKKSRH